MDIRSRTSAGGFTVTLRRDPETSALRVDVLHRPSGEQISLATTPARAGYDFLHPFAGWLEAARPAAALAA
jgi:hypothetical protein